MVYNVINSDNVQGKTDRQQLATITEEKYCERDLSTSDLYNDVLIKL